MDAGDNLFGVVYARGQEVFAQGDHGDTMYVIQSGAIELTRTDGDRNVVLAILERGDFFGEMALIDDGLRSAGARALQVSRLLPISRTSLIDHTRRDPSTMLRIMAALCFRIEKTNRILKSIIESDEDLRNMIAAGGSSRGLSNQVSISPSDSAGELGMSVCEGKTEVQGAPVDIAWRPLSDDIGSLIHVEPGQTIFRQGDQADGMYIVLEGEVEVVQESGDQKSRIASLGKNDFFGEMALITGSARSSTVAAITRAKLAHLKVDDFLSKIASEPEMGLYIVQTLISRLRATNAAINDPAKCLNIAKNVAPPKMKKRSRVKVAIISLASCGGCSASLLQDPAKLAQLTDVVEICYCPMLMDEERFAEADLTLVDGIVRLKDEEEKLLEARAKSRFLVAWGSCSAIGGIPSLANEFELESLLEETYSEALDPLAYYLSSSERHSSEIYLEQGAKLLRKARKIDDIVRVDYFVPGCPPSVTSLVDVALELTGKLEGKELKQIVCSECPRKPKKTDVGKMSCYPQSGLDSTRCLVSMGCVCLGFVTRGGCGAVCTKGGLPCWGCRGPSQGSIQRINQGDCFEEIVLKGVTQRTNYEEETLKPFLRNFKNKGCGALAFDVNFVRDGSRLR
jgi:F420-non-reducing hydrogenase small subunit